MNQENRNSFHSFKFPLLDDLTALKHRPTAKMLQKEIFKYILFSIMECNAMYVMAESEKKVKFSLVEKAKEIESKVGMVD